MAAYNLMPQFYYINAQRLSQIPHLVSLNFILPFEALEVSTWHYHG